MFTEHYEKDVLLDNEKYSLHQNEILFGSPEAYNNAIKTEKSELKR